MGIIARGVVQGVGFRPFVCRSALARGLSGWVRNERDSVRIEVQGSEAALESFEAALRLELPRPARLVEVGRTPLPERLERGFRILQSEATRAVGFTLPPDLAMCEACWRDICEPGSRRHGYPFTTCAVCGPRYSIALSLPYDRQNTTMRGFELCRACAEEYHDLKDRRYHAQPIACPACGPTLDWLSSSGARLCSAEAALTSAVAALNAGKVVAIHGLSGFQLMVNATDPQAVLRLRARKRRPHKPFAVMFESLLQLEKYALVSSAERALLMSAEAPIVLLERRPNRELATQVSPELSSVGAMLAYTPLHRLLLTKFGAPVVCTSGNRQDEPICIDVQKALERLSGVADGFLCHDRPIARPLDDSVVRVFQAGTFVFRRARGYAPLPAATVRSRASVLALGAYLKSTVTLCHQGSLVVSQHLGDLGALESRELHRRTVDDLCQFFEVRPEQIACDLHPDYPSTRLGERLSEEYGVPLVRVQHHHAHVAAAVAEHQLKGAVLGLAWDGTGYGSDGTIWGGEALVCERARFARCARLDCFPLPGGDRAAREPERSALGVLFAFGRDELEKIARPWFGDQLELHLAALHRGLNTPLCASVGRLFDAFAALLGLGDACSFEGQAAIKLEQLAKRVPADGAYELPLTVHAGKPAVGDPRPLLAAALADRAKGVETARIARRFHEALIDFGLCVARHVGVEQVVLSGGCFQNQVLMDGLHGRLRRSGFAVYAPNLVPLNDGGISLGQAYIAAELAQDRREPAEVTAERTL